MGFGTYDMVEEGSGRFLACYRPPVPPMPPLGDVWDAVEDARRQVEIFDRALSGFPVPGVIGKLFARLDAVHSSGAEGATTTFSDLLEYQSARRRAPDPEDAAGVAGCAAAFDDLQQPGGVFDPQAAALTIHRRLFEAARDPYFAATAGTWKRRANATLDPETPTGFFYYASPTVLSAALAEWSAFSMADGGPPLLRQALAHWMFEHIHPLEDGNGRVGRLLLPLTLRAKGTGGHACAFVGEAVHRDKDIYIAALKRGRTTGDMGGWARVFLAMIGRTAVWNLERLLRLQGVLADWRRQATGVRSHSVIHRLLPWVLTHPSFTIGDALAGMGQGTFASINTAVARLVDWGVVVPAGNEARDRLFTASAVIDLFEASPVAVPAEDQKNRSSMSLSSASVSVTGVGEGGGLRSSIAVPPKKTR